MNKASILSQIVYACLSSITKLHNKFESEESIYLLLAKDRSPE